MVQFSYFIGLNCICILVSLLHTFLVFNFPCVCIFFYSQSMNCGRYPAPVDTFSRAAYSMPKKVKFWLKLRFHLSVSAGADNTDNLIVFYSFFIAHIAVSDEWRSCVDQKRLFGQKHHHQRYEHLIYVLCLMFLCEVTDSLLMHRLSLITW